MGDAQIRTHGLAKSRHRKLVERRIKARENRHDIAVAVVDAVEVCGLTLLPPDINLSDYRFMPVGEPPSVTKKKVRQIRYGLGAVKGSGQNAIEAIMAARQEKPFTDLFDFAKRVDKRQINRRTIDALGGYRDGRRGAG